MMPTLRTTVMSWSSDSCRGMCNSFEFISLSLLSYFAFTFFHQFHNPKKLRYFVKLFIILNMFCIHFHFLSQACIIHQFTNFASSSFHFHFLSQVCIIHRLTIDFKPFAGTATTYFVSQRFVCHLMKSLVLDNKRNTFTAYPLYSGLPNVHGPMFQFFIFPYLR